MKSRAWECLCLAAFLALTAWQLFLPPVTGLSDNNDFPKVLGPAQICQAPVENVNTYFVTSFTAGPKCDWQSGFTSSEILFFNAARHLTLPFTGSDYFDIRASAAIHLLVLGVAMALFLRLTARGRSLVRFLLPPLAILMFTDVAYVAYLNSAYMDNASWVLFLLLAGIAATGCLEPAQTWVPLAYAVAGVLLVFSKAQHAPLGIPFAALAGYFAWRSRKEPTAWSLTAWSGAALALLVSAAMMPLMAPPEYQTISLYNLIFYRLAPSDPTLLPQLGLDAGYRKWVGSSAFDAGSPLADANWSQTLESQVSFGSVARLYLRHPGVAWREIDRELHDSAHTLRPSYMANYRQADGFPPHSIATRFSLWSDLKMSTLARLPYSLVVLYALPLLAVAAKRTPLLPLALALAAAGASEFALCTLADGVDTHRHLFLFQVITDALLLLTTTTCANRSLQA
jgi:hypothetical protein